MEDDEEFLSPPTSPPPTLSEVDEEKLKQDDRYKTQREKNLELATEELNSYLNVVQKLSPGLTAQNYKNLRKDLSEIRREYKIRNDDLTQINLIREVERTMDSKVEEINPKLISRKRKRITDDNDDASSEKQRSLSLFEKLRNNSESIYNIKTQSNVLINGVTKSGKSTFIANLFSTKYWSFADMIKNVYLFSKIDVQEAWANLQRNCESLGITLHVKKTIDSLPDLQSTIPKQSVLIVDDFMVDAIKDKKLMNLLTDLFNVTTHHNDIISIFTLHNLFADGFRTMRLNSDYIFLFINPVDLNSVKFFFRQLESEQKAQLLFVAYKEALTNSVPFGIQIMKNLEHKFFYGYTSLIMFVNDDELKDIQAQYKLTNNGSSV